MSIYADINALKQSSAAEDNFNKQLREGLLTIPNGMEIESYRRGDALEQLEQRLRNGGYLQQPTEDLEAKIRCLEAENAALQEENRLLRRQTEKANAASQQSFARTVLSNKRKKMLARVISTAITHGNEAHTYIKARANSMAEDASTEDQTVAILSDAERKSLDLKQALNNLVDMVKNSRNNAGAQDLKSAMRSWGDVYRSLVLEREKASSRRDKQNDRTWDIFKEDRALVREQIMDLRNIAEELSLDMRRISEDASL